MWIHSNDLFSQNVISIDVLELCPLFSALLMQIEKNSYIEMLSC